jgi:predicted oxidoreductase
VPDTPAKPDDLPNLIDDGPRRIGELPEVGPLAFGCWRFVGTDVAKGRELIETSLELGMNLVDTADIYGRGPGGEGFGAAEELLGKVLAEAPDLRDEMVIATKGGIRTGVPFDSSPDYLRSACEASMRRLGVDVIDLYQIHRPDLFGLPHEVAGVLDELVGEGKVREIGVSNYSTHQVEALIEYLEGPLSSTQLELSAHHVDPLLDGTLDQAQREGMAILAWSPLAGGALATGEGLRPELLAALDELAARESCSRAVLALGFVLALPGGPVAILGTQQPQRLRDMQRVLEIHLDRADCYRIVSAATGNTYS